MANNTSLFRNCDLDNEEEIGVLVQRFYSDVSQDEILGHIFNDVAHVNWDDHLPKIKQFWAKVLLGIQGYDGDPLAAHQKIHLLEPFTHSHFRRWLELFQETVDLGWEGPHAQEIKRKAVKIAQLHSRYFTGEPIDVLLTIKNPEK